MLINVYVVNVLGKYAVVDGIILLALIEGNIYAVNANKTGKNRSDTMQPQTLYGRRYRIFVSTNDGTAFDVSSLRCTFSVTKTMQMQPNYSEITIYNLAPETENSIIREGYRVVIEAGYEGQQYGLIYDGNIIQAIHTKENGTDYLLTITALDGDRFLNFGIVNFSLARGQTMRQVITDCAAKASNPAQLGTIAESMNNAQLTRGKVVFGMARDYLRQLAKSQEATFYVNDGKVNIIRAETVPAGEVIDLSPSSGLIDAPEQSEYGVAAKMLLNPSVNINGRIHIDNSLVRAAKVEIGQPFRPLDHDGLYRVIKVTHSGDTRGDDWYTEVETVSQSGFYPALVGGAGYNLW